MKRIDFEHGTITGNILGRGITDAGGTDIESFV